MLKRTLYFTNPMMLALKDNQLVYWVKEDSDNKHSIPIEDIGFVIIESQMINITIPLLNALVNNNVGVVICDSMMMPNALIQPFSGNNTQAEIFKAQIEASESIKKNIWKQCVEMKIRNQSSLLTKFDRDGELLKPLYMNVKSGDTTNREGIAAKLYWQELFGKSFLRSRVGLPPNNLLNYGYTILRAAVVRALVGSGIHPAFGIFHHNKYNSFPLADDIMEAYRPFVDELVYNLFYRGENDLNKEVKSQLLRLLFVDCKFEKMCRPLEIALTITTSSYAKCLLGKSKKLALPLLK